MAIKKIMVWLLCLVCTAPMAQSPGKVVHPANARQETQRESGAKLDSPGPTQAQLVIYRTEEDGLAGSTSVFVNGAYHTTLDKGVYREDCVMHGDIELHVKQTRAGERGRRSAGTITALQLPAGSTSFLRVRAQAGEPVVETVPAAQAEEELGDKRPQQRTLSRVAQSCTDGSPPGDAMTPSAESKPE